MNTRMPDVVTVAVTRVDGGLTVLKVVITEYRPTTDEEKAEGKGERIANWTKPPTTERIEKIIEKYGWKGTPLEAVSWRYVANEFVHDATDRTFRDAWKDSGTHEPDHDMTRARDIHRRRLRQKRANLLEALDVEYQKADEQGNAELKKQIAAKKQIFRDVTNHPDIEAAQTVVALKDAAMSVLD